MHESLMSKINMDSYKTVDSVPDCYIQPDFTDINNAVHDNYIFCLYDKYSPFRLNYYHQRVGLLKVV